MRTGKIEDDKGLGLGIFIIMLIIGVVTGTVLLNLATSSQQSILSAITSKFIESRSSQTFVQNFCSSLISTSVFLIITFFMGYFALGKPISLFIPMFKGLGIGISMADVFVNNGINGYIICAVLILPNALISSFAIMLASREAAKNSGKIFSFVCSRPLPEDDGIKSGLYIIKFAVLFGLAVIGGIVDAVMIFLFSGVIN